MDRDVIAYLAKARESLATAESEFVNARYNSCANRCYYACLQAAIAALRRAGFPARSQWPHEFVQAQFSGQLINRRKHYRAELQRILPDNQGLRNLADYRPDFVTRTQAGRALARSKVFVNAVSEREGNEP